MAAQNSPSLSSSALSTRMWLLMTSIPIHIKLSYVPNNFLNHDRFGAGSVAVDFCNRISISGGTGVWMASWRSISSTFANSCPACDCVLCPAASCCSSKVSLRFIFQISRSAAVSKTSRSRSHRAAADAPTPAHSRAPTAGVVCLLRSFMRIFQTRHQTPAGRDAACRALRRWTVRSVRRFLHSLTLHRPRATAAGGIHPAGRPGFYGCVR